MCHRPFAFLAFLLLAGLAACGVDASTTGAAAAPAPAEPTIAIGPMRKATFSGGAETFSWSIDGTLRGELKATLRQFADGEETVLAVTTFSTAEMAVTGNLVLLLRDAPWPGQASGRFADVCLAVDRDQRVAPRANTTSSSSQTSEPVAIPTNNNGAFSWAGGGTMKCVPDQYNVMQLWSQAFGQLGTVSNLSPWVAQQQSLRKHCVDGAVSVVLTLEVDLDAPSVPRPAR